MTPQEIRAALVQEQQQIVRDIATWRQRYDEITEALKT
jgi:hypothetical protein